MRRVAPTLAALVLACTWGPPELEVRVANHVASPNDARFAFAVHYAWMRRPTGLSTFPDGGRWLILNQAAAVYDCDTVSLATARRWHAERPDAMRSGFEPWMGPWTADGVYVSLRGYRDASRGRDNLVREDYRLDPDGRVTPVDREPPRDPATSRPQRCEAAVLALAREEYLAVIGVPEP